MKTDTAPKTGAKRGRKSNAEIAALAAAATEASSKLGAQQQAAAPDDKTAAKPKRMTRQPKAAEPEMQTQAAAPAEPDAAKAPPKTKPAGSGRGRKPAAQQQAAPDENVAEQQGATSAGDIKEEAKAPLIGGAKQVMIEEVPMPPRPGRPQKEEEYPFAMLQPARKEGKEIIGPSFFIPEADDPSKHVSAARKRHTGALFWVRPAESQINGKGPKVRGSRVWRGSREFTA